MQVAEISPDKIAFADWSVGVSNLLHFSVLPSWLSIVPAVRMVISHISWMQRSVCMTVKLVEARQKYIYIY